MAKITLENGMVIEGTVDELKEMAKSFVELKEDYLKVDRKPQVGDFVKFSENVCDVTPGKYYEVTKLDSDGDPMIIDDIDDEYCLYGDEDSFEVFEKVSKISEEQAVAEKWAKIGRKPNEFKKGDIVRVVKIKGGIVTGHPEGVIGEVEYDTTPIDLGTGNPSLRYGGLSLRCNVELVTPVEARFDRA